MFKIRWSLGAAVAFSVVAGLPSLARGEFVIQSQSVDVNRMAREVTFRLTFNQPPDFTTADSEGRPKHSFQYFFDSVAEDPQFDGPDVSIIRGPEIRFDHAIPIRDSLNPDGTDFPHAEGWGPTRGMVDFSLAGDEVKFTVPWKMLGETDGRFSYDVMAFEFGTQTSEFRAVVIPLPASVCTGGVALPVIFFIARKARRLV